MSGMDIPDYSYRAKLSNVYHARDKVDWNKYDSGQCMLMTNV